MARPKSYDEQLRTALLEGAARTIAEGGVHGLVMRRLAAQHGTSTSAIYALFGGKPGLLEAVVNQGVASLTEAMSSVVITSDATADLREIGRVYRRWALGHRDLYAAMFGRQMVPVAGREGTVMQLLGQGLAPVIGALGRLAAQGRLRSADLPTVGMCLWSGIHGIVDLEHGIYQYLLPVPARDAVYETYLDAMIRAWLIDPPAAPAE